MAAQAFGAEPENHGAPLLLTIDQVAARLGCSRRTVYRLIDAGDPATRLPTVKPFASRTPRVRESDLTEFLRRLPVSTPAQDQPC